MASFSCKLMFVGIFLFCTLQTGHSLQCYACNLPPLIACVDPFVNTTAINRVNCNERNYGCLKQIVPAKGNQGMSVHRGCASVAFCDVHAANSDHCSICTGDLCNSTSIVFPSLTAVFLSVIIKYFARI